jgi:hypothetical protein
MATKIKLGNRPTSFKKTVTFQLHEGEQGAIDCQFKYRTRTDFGAFVDAMFKDAGQPTPTSADFSMKRLMESTRDKNADYLLEALDGWDVDRPLDRTNAQQLADELPGAIVAIMEGYRAACVEGRMGN